MTDRAERKQRNAEARRHKAEDKLLKRAGAIRGQRAAGAYRGAGGIQRTAWDSDTRILEAADEILRKRAQ